MECSCPNPSESEKICQWPFVGESERGEATLVPGGGVKIWIYFIKDDMWDPKRNGTIILMERKRSMFVVRSPLSVVKNKALRPEST
jgi:hypothetical protein